MGRYRAYPEYKDSGMEWLKQIPKHWVKKKIKWEITASSGVDQKNDDGVFDLYGANGIIGKSNSSGINHKHGVVLVGRVGSAGAINFVQDVCAVSDNALIVKNNTFDVVRFDFYLLLSLNLEELVSKNAQPLITASNMREIIAAVPSGAVERMKIANFLDHETAKIDMLIEKQQQLIQLLKEKRQAVISHAVTKGLNPDVPMKDSGVEWLGEVPEHWEITRVGWFCEFISYGFTNPMPSTDEGPYMLTATDIEFGRVRYEEARRTSLDSFKKLLSPKSIPKKGDVLVTKDGTLGRVAVFEGEYDACISQSVALLRLNRRKILPEFLALAFSGADYQSKIIFDAGGTTIKHIYISVLAKMNFVLPDIREQERLIDQLGLKLRSMDLLIDQALLASDLLSERRTALISAAVTGKIDVRLHASRPTGSP